MLINSIKGHLKSETIKIKSHRYEACSGYLLHNKEIYYAIVLCDNRIRSAQWFEYLILPKPKNTLTEDFVIVLRSAEPEPEPENAMLTSITNKRKKI